MLISGYCQTEVPLFFDPLNFPAISLFPLKIGWKMGGSRGFNNEYKIGLRNSSANLLCMNYPPQNRSTKNRRSGLFPFPITPHAF